MEARVGAGVARVGAQGFAVGGFGAEELALLGQQVTEQDLAFRLLRIGLDGALASRVARSRSPTWRAAWPSWTACQCMAER